VLTDGDGVNHQTNSVESDCGPKRV